MEEDRQIREMLRQKLLEKLVVEVARSPVDCLRALLLPREMRWCVDRVRLLLYRVIAPNDDELAAEAGVVANLEVISDLVDRGPRDRGNTATA